MTTEPTQAHDLVVETVEFRVADRVRITPQQWEARTAETLAALAEDEIPPSALYELLRTFMFAGPDGRTWCYTGGAWLVWGASAWTAAQPPETLSMRPFTMDVAVVPPEPPPITARTSDEYRATHVVPAGGLDARSLPDPASPSSAHLTAGLDVMVTDWRDDGWAQIVCSNGWTTWVDGRRLDPVGSASVRPPAPPPPLAWRPTHRVGGQGAAAYAQMGDAQPVARLDPWLDVQVIDEHASGWAHVVCSNSWSTWIDRRTLTPM